MVEEKTRAGHEAHIVIFNFFLVRLLFHCVRFWLLRDKNQVLFISVSPGPSTVLRKQWMLN